MIKEIIQSISGNVKERASSPLLGSYTLAAILLNWQPIAILLTSYEKGQRLVDEVANACPGLYHSLIYPAIFSLSFSIIYPTLKAIVITINTYAKVIELRSEYRMEELKEKISIKKNDIESIIRLLNEPEIYEKIGYHDLKRILESLPKEKDLRINTEPKSV